MKEAISFILDAAKVYRSDANKLRSAGDHIAAAREEKTAKALEKIAKAARLIFLP